MSSYQFTNYFHIQILTFVAFLSITYPTLTLYLLFLISPFYLLFYFPNSFLSFLIFSFFCLFFLAVYVGDLKPIFTAFSGLAVTGDHLIFTIENKDIDESNIPVEVEVGADVQAVATPLVSLKEMKKRTADWILQKSGRFAHSREYVKKVVKTLPNLSIVTFQDIVPRYVRACTYLFFVYFYFCFYFYFFVNLMKLIFCNDYDNHS